MEVAKGKGRTWLIPMDLSDGLPVALEDDCFSLLFDGFDESGEAAFGFVHVDGDHGYLG
jgi:hypothetical protein